MKSWESTTLDDLYAEPSRNGLTRPKSVRGSGHRMINMGEIFAHERIGNIEMERVQMTEKEIASFEVKNGDLLFARQSLVLAGAGKCSLVKFVGETTTFESHLIRVRLNPMRAVPDFFFYYFISPQGKQNVQSIVMQVAAAGIRGSELAKLEVPVPPLPVQRRIAGILSAYDELIENCQRRIKILESIVRTLYREWFVHFRFPGHENHLRVASTLGEIPYGWDVTTLRSVTTKIGSGATPRGGKDSYKTEGMHLIRSLNIYDYGFEFANLALIDDEQAAALDNVTVEKDDVLLNITGASVARCALVPSYLLPARVNQHVAIVRADSSRVSPFYVLDAINSDQRKQQLLTLAQGGATREALTKVTIGNFEIVLPPRHLMERYDDVAGCIHRQREVLLRQVQNLRGARNLLLPRLLTGQIDVEAA